MLGLVFEDGGVTHRVPVRDGLTLGRSSDNDVVLRDFSVSRHHARVEEADGTLRIIDLGSTNGIRVNEDFVEPTVEAIIKGARTGEIGDGKIVILDLVECIRIRTGETGSEAIG